MIKKRTWNEFRETGLLWWINRLLHTFGWAIVFEVEPDDGSVSNVYPARCRFRGFDEKTESEGFAKVTAYMKENAAILLTEAEDCPEQEHVKEK